MITRMSDVTGHAEEEAGRPGNADDPRAARRPGASQEPSVAPGAPDAPGTGAPGAGAREPDVRPDPASGRDTAPGPDSAQGAGPDAGRDTTQDTAQAPGPDTAQDTARGPGPRTGPTTKPHAGQVTGPDAGPRPEPASRPGATPGAGRTASPGAPSTEDGGAREDDLRARRRAAARTARVLWRGGPLRTLREQLTALVEDAGAVCDLDAPVDVYGDGVVEALEERVAALLGTEAAVFFPTGTMAQQVALRCWAGRTGSPAVALHGLAHPEVHERHAFSQVSGLRPVRLTSEPRPVTAEDVREAPEPFGTLMLELPLRDAGFLLPAWEELTEVVEEARERDAVVHFDGARLWETTVRLGRPLHEIAGLADSVYVSFYKSLDGVAGAALAGPRALADEARAWRHRYGGTAFQQFPAALAALAGLERELPRLPEYVRHARVVAAALRDGLAASGVPWARVHPGEPHTHQFQVWLPYPPEPLLEVSVRQAEETGTFLFPGHWRQAGPGLACTEVTVGAEGLAWTPEDVRRAAADFADRLEGLCGPASRRA